MSMRYAGIALFFVAIFIVPVGDVGVIAFADSVPFLGIHLEVDHVEKEVAVAGADAGADRIFDCVEDLVPGVFGRRPGPTPVNIRTADHKGTCAADLGFGL